MLRHLNSNILYPILEKATSRDIRSKVNELNKFEQMNEIEKMAFKKNNLYSITAHAANEVPYYKDLFKKIKFDPENLKKDINFFNDIPFLTKDIIKEQKSRLLCTKMLSESRHGRKTGGSTGSAVHIFYDQEALDWTAAVNLYSIGLTGRKKTDLEVHISSYFDDKAPFKAKLKETLKCNALNRKNILTSSLDKNELEQTFQKLKSLSPFIVQAHPSTIYALAIYIKENIGKLSSPLFSAFESTGESIDSKKVQAIETYIGCKVYNRYGNAEFGVIAHSKDSFTQLECIERVIYAENFTLEESLSEIVITNYTNNLMPLLRYRTGDLGKVININNKKHLINVEGRIHDLIEISGKQYPTHYVQDVLDRIGGFDEFQIVKHKNNDLTLKLVKSENNKLQDDEIFKKIRDFFKSNINIELTDFNSLSRCGWREKFRYVVDE